MPSKRALKEVKSEQWGEVVTLVTLYTLRPWFMGHSPIQVGIIYMGRYTAPYDRHVGMFQALCVFVMFHLR